MPDPDPSPPSGVPSGVPYGVRTTRRRGRMSAAKHEAITDLLPRWTVARPVTRATLDATFDRTAPLLLDVGVGTGEATRHWATAHADHDVVAVELHRPGVAQLCRALETEGPPNVRVLEADVITLLEDLSGRPSPQPSRPTSGPGALNDPAPTTDGPTPDTDATAAGTTPAPEVRFAQVRVLFPDPWPKARHRRRRLVDPWFVAAIADVLAPGGCLHLATDWDDYADHMREALATEHRLLPEGDHEAAGWRSARPDRPVTTYERRGLQAGRAVTDLVLRRSDR